MNLNPIVLSIPVLFLWIGIELVLERLSHRKLYRFPNAIANLSCGITSQVSGLFLRILAEWTRIILFGLAALVITSLVKANFLFYSIAVSYMILSGFWFYQINKYAKASYL